MSHKILAFILFNSCIAVFNTSFAQSGGDFPCKECDHIVTGYETDGSILNIKPGETLCLVAVREYGRLLIKNLNGTPEKPITVRNCGGVATIYANDGFGMKFQNSKNFILTGDGSGKEAFGIKITTEKGFFLMMEHFTTDFEISRIEIAGVEKNGLGEKNGFAGIGIKTSPYQDCELFQDSTKQAWTMQNISIHNNYIHDIGGEGLYIGHGFYMGREESRCPDGMKTYPHTIKGLKIYENLIENVGFDGIQIKDANEDVEVYHNLVRNYGTQNHGAHNEGLFIGEGTTGKFYENIFDTGTGNGCQIQGIGNIDIINNCFLNSGKHGMYAASGSHAFRWEDGYFNIAENVIYNSSNIGFVFYNNKGGKKSFNNNLVIQAHQLTKKGAEMEMSGNIFSNHYRYVPVVNEKVEALYSTLRSKLNLKSPN